jgi:hypothetical protein
MHGLKTRATLRVMAEVEPPQQPPPLTPEEIRASRIWVIVFLVVSIPLGFGLLGLVIWTLLRAM